VWFTIDDIIIPANTFDQGASKFGVTNLELIPKKCDFLGSIVSGYLKMV
jgi:hypothetical protein